MNKMENNWEQEIRAKNMERVISITFQLADISKAMEADLEKAVVTDVVEKTGKEIKQNLQAELTSVAEAKQVLLGRMTKLVKGIGQDPNGKADRQIMKGFENQIGDVPKQYEYGQIYIDNTVEKAGQMREFNKAAGDYIRRNIEELKLKTTIDNLPDDRVVKLSKALADQLGF